MIEKCFDGEKFCVLTHWDLDGITSYIVVKNYFGKQIEWFIPCGVSRVFENIMKLSQDFENILILDLSLSQEDVDLVNSLFDKKMIIDHHDSSLNLDIPFDNHINVKASASFLCYQLLKEKMNFNNNMKRLIKYTNDYDTWNLHYYDSRILNNVFWEMGAYEFLSEFKDGVKNFCIGDENYELGIKIEKTKEKVVKSFETYKIDDVVRIVVGDKFISDIQLYYPDEPYTLIVQKNKIHFRSREKSLMEFFEKMSEKGLSGGGHKFAGAIPTTDRMERLRLIEYFCEYVGAK